MRATARLIWTYFTATRLTRTFAGIGAMLTAAGLIIYLFVPAWTLGSGVRPEDLWVQSLMLGTPLFGLIGLVISTTLMPAIVERIALGRSIWVLPHGRVRLLASVLVPALLLAALTAATTVFAFLHYPISVPYGRVFYRTLLMSFEDFGLIYLAIWLVSKTSGVWRLVGMLGVVVSITIPLRYVGGSLPPFTPIELTGLIAWGAFALLLLAGGRLRHTLTRGNAGIRRAARRLLPSVSYRQGRELDLMLGTTRPWIVAIGQLVPIAVMIGLNRYPPIWIVFVLLFSAIAGAITSTAAPRSKALWLRFDWTREQIRMRVERAFLRYNLWSLAVLLAVFIALGQYGELGLRVIALGLGLIALGAVASHYLGLMITRGLGRFESALCVLTMTAMTLAALAIARSQLTAAAEFMAVLFVLAIGFRASAKTRWLSLDWMQCRPERPARGSA
jgi:hypothetical protein